LSALVAGQGAYLGGHPAELEAPIHGRFEINATSVFVNNLDYHPPRRAVVPWSSVASVSLEQYDRQRSKIGPVLVFGLLGLAARGTTEGTLLTVRLNDGAVVYYLAQSTFATFRANVVPILRDLAVTVTEPGVSAPAISVADELEKLAHLRDRGVLTEEEFAAQKARLLG